MVLKNKLTSIQFNLQICWMLMKNKLKHFRKIIDLRIKQIDFVKISQTFWKNLTKLHFPQLVKSLLVNKFKCQVCYLTNLLLFQKIFFINQVKYRNGTTKQLAIRKLCGNIILSELQPLYQVISLSVFFNIVNFIKYTKYY